MRARTPITEIDALRASSASYKGISRRLLLGAAMRERRSLESRRPDGHPVKKNRI